MVCAKDLAMNAHCAHHIGVTSRRDGPRLFKTLRKIRAQLDESSKPQTDMVPRQRFAMKLAAAGTFAVADVQVGERLGPLRGRLRGALPRAG